MSYRTEGDRAWIKWKDTKFYRDDEDISEIAKVALEKLLAVRKARRDEEVLEEVARQQEHHDFYVKWWGWTGLCKPRTITFEEVDTHVHWYADRYGKDVALLFRQLQRAGETADDMTFSLQSYRSLVSWYTYDSKGE